MLEELLSCLDELWDRFFEELDKRPTDIPDKIWQKYEKEFDLITEAIVELEKLNMC